MTEHPDTSSQDPVLQNCGSCGHSIRDHEDYDFDIHECNSRGCTCMQFLDTAVPTDSDYQYG